MSELLRKDIVGQKIAEVAISVPDTPVTMDGLSFSAGYVRLESGVLIDLCGATSPLEASEVDLQSLKRDRRHEAEFRPAIGARISDLLVTADLGCLCVVTDGGYIITRVPALFWDRPCLYRPAEWDVETEPLWPV